MLIVNNKKIVYFIPNQCFRLYGINIKLNVKYLIFVLHQSREQKYTWKQRKYLENINH